MSTSPIIKDKICKSVEDGIIYRYEYEEIKDMHDKFLASGLYERSKERLFKSLNKAEND